MHAIALPLALMATTLLGAATPDDLRATLRGLHPRGDLLATARFTLREEHPSDRRFHPVEKQGQLQIHATEAGEVRTGAPATHAALGESLDPRELHQLLDQAQVLLAWLDRAQGSGPDAAPAGASSPLTFRLPPEPPARLRHRLVTPEGSLKIWLGEDGLPQRATLEQCCGGRPLRIAPDERLHVRLQVTFQAAAGRLMVRRLEEDREESIGYDVVRRLRTIELDPRT